jgi:FtsP/CotA-like multicopper oxidase with cupredoxin domain
MKIPLSVYRVAQGKRYRFRLVGGLCSECPVRVKFEDHQMLVIATDGKPVEPILVDSVVLEAGRYFFKSQRNCASAGLRQCPDTFGVISPFITPKIGCVAYEECRYYLAYTCCTYFIC